MSNAYTSPYINIPVAERDVDTRARFVSRTYMHLMGAILAFTGIEVFLFKSGIAERIAGVLGSNWLLVLGGFIVVSWMASRVAHSARTLPALQSGLRARRVWHGFHRQNRR